MDHSDGKCMEWMKKGRRISSFSQFQLMMGLYSICNYSRTLAYMNGIFEQMTGRSVKNGSQFFF